MANAQNEYLLNTFVQNISQIFHIRFHRREKPTEFGRMSETDVEGKNYGKAKKRYKLKWLQKWFCNDTRILYRGRFRLQSEEEERREYSIWGQLSGRCKLVKSCRTAVPYTIPYLWTLPLSLIHIFVVHFNKNCLDELNVMRLKTQE